MNSRPIFMIDNDEEELEMVQEIWQEMKVENRLEVFNDTELFLRRMREKNVNPFMIISDVNLGKIDGFKLRQMLCDDIDACYKSIPFIFWSTAASNEQIKHAYDSGAHGFFLKGLTYPEIKKSLMVIMAYWGQSKVPELPSFQLTSSKNGYQ